MNKIRNIRIKHGYTQNELAEKVGVTRQHIGKIELGQTSPRISLLEALAKVFNVTTTSLV